MHSNSSNWVLADRLLELTGAVTGRNMPAQILDDMALDQERGITIKPDGVRLDYQAHYLAFAN